ncbi:MAG: hypothetical protein B7C54_04800 [Acidimicrobiales bacterium mtb01]|nr:DUF3090 family protein [Actinomycetota bacterium]TEX46533.1 MAG: hypothetical protein B7C54_04800 [Acidimicrobiales bacterium mtb01]
MSDSIEFDRVDVFTTGALGAPGRRVFYLQARLGDRIATVRCEKQQAAAIAQYLRRALAHLPIIEGGRFPESMSLTPPDDEPFVLGSVGLEFRKESDLFTLVLREFDTDGDTDEDAGDNDDDDDDLFGDDDIDEGSSVRVSITRNQALAFCDHTDKIVAAGRPDCEYCKRPVDPDGHFCPRMN